MLRGKPGSPSLCAACLHNRTTIDKLRAECEILTKVYVAAAMLRTFPVPFDDPSQGFHGYDWMVESILRHGKFYADHE